MWNWINKNVAFSATASSKVKLFSLLGCKMQFNGNRLKREKHSVKYSLSILSSMANIQSWKLENSFAPWGKYSSTICMTLWNRWQRTYHQKNTQNNSLAKGLKDKLQACLRTRYAFEVRIGNIDAWWSTINIAFDRDHWLFFS